MYGSGKASYGMIARLFNVSRTAVSKWVRKFSAVLPEPQIEGGIEQIQIDEMGHFINKKQKIWVWRALDCATGRTIGWHLGDRSGETFKEFYEKLKHLNATFYVDDWKVYPKVIPSERIAVGKEHTITIEQNNSNIRHYLGRMTRRTKVVSRSAEMVDLSLRLC